MRINSDLVGPYKVYKGIIIAYNSSRFFNIILYNYNKELYITLLKVKSESLLAFKAFKVN